MISHHGMGKENSNEILLLSTCAQNALVKTNTAFQQLNEYKTRGCIHAHITAASELCHCKATRLTRHQANSSYERIWLLV